MDTDYQHIKFLKLRLSRIFYKVYNKLGYGFLERFMKMQ